MFHFSTNAAQIRYSTYLANIGSERISSPTPSTSTTKATSYFFTVVETKSTCNSRLRISYCNRFSKRSLTIRGQWDVNFWLPELFTAECCSAVTLFSKLSLFSHFPDHDQYRSREHRERFSNYCGHLGSPGATLPLYFHFQWKCKADFWERIFATALLSLPFIFLQFRWLL